MLVSRWSTFSYCSWVLWRSMMLRSPEIGKRWLGVGFAGGATRKETRVDFLLDVSSGGVSGRLVVDGDGLESGGGGQG